MKFKYLLIIPLLAIPLLLSGCSNVEREPSNNDKAVEACIKKGGVPILGRTGGYSELIIQDCKFKEADGERY